ncbi:MAG: hypothetical protein NC300_02530 [Bacteroidales bacterium]|nr:hypothetical protein [Clostridium sp.]MCM1202994.1 hypothetical protein [Bacteroidales bacterium]
MNKKQEKILNAENIDENRFFGNLKSSFRREYAKFGNICTACTPIIIIIYIILFVIAVIIDVLHSKEIGFTIRFSGKITLIIMGIFTAIYWIPKIIFILIECIFKSKR